MTETVDVWSIDLDEAPVDRLAALLDRDEQARCTALAGPRGRSRFVAAHGLTRVILSTYLGVAPQDVRFRTGKSGKPSSDGISFNLSHSREQGLVAVTGLRAVGVDVEHHDGRDVKALAARYFPRSEQDEVRAGRGPAFVRLWTRKEACVKAAGTRLAAGLRLPVGGDGDQVLVPGGPWLVRDLQAPPGYGAAVALAGPEPYRVVPHHWTELRREAR